VDAVGISAVIAVSTSFLSAIIFGIRLIGPLTLSYGQPSLVAWLVFAIFPLLLTFVGLLLARPWPVKIALFAEGIWIVLMTIDLLRVHRVV